MFVQFTDATETVVCAVFACEQGAGYPNQGNISAIDSRYLAFLTPLSTLAQQAATASVSGLTIALTGTMTLAATTFPTDAITTGKIANVVTALTVSGVFPGGGTTYPMRDASEIWHTFTEAQYKTVAGAIATYVAACDLIADGNPNGATALPASSVTLTV